MECVLAFDIGEKRVGIAASDFRGRVSSPVDVLTLSEVTQRSPRLKRIVEDHEPALFLFGLPRSLSGEESAQTQRVRALAKQIAQVWEMPYDFCDERLSSKEAKRILRESGLDERKQRGKVDMVAASLFLQTYLDGHVAPEDAPRQ